jgi:hypothetical protein
MRRSTLLLVPALLGLALPAAAATFPCQPCAGLRFVPAPAPEAAPAPPPAPTEPPAAQPAQAPVPEPAPSPAGPGDFARSLKEAAHLEPGSPVYIAWEVLLQGGGQGGGVPDPQLAETVRQAGATPWIALVFTTPGPLTQGGERLQGELRAAADLAGKAPAGTWFQIVWRPEAGTFSATEYAFLVKRAAVAVTGAQTAAQVAAGPLPLDPAAIQAFYGEEVAAYLEAVVLPDGPAGEVERAVAALAEADPGREVVLDGAPFPAPPADPAEIMATAARNAARGLALTLFRAPSLPPASLAPATAPFAVLAREFGGDLSYESGAAPAGGEESWVFVRGKDLALRVIALAPPGAKSLGLSFADPALRRPIRYPVSFRRVPPPTGRGTAQGLDLELAEPGRVVVLGLERARSRSPGSARSRSRRSCAGCRPLRMPRGGRSSATRRSTPPTSVSSHRPARRLSRRRSRAPTSGAPRRGPTGPGRPSTSTASSGAARPSPRSR